MIFDDDFLQLTGQKDIDEIAVSEELSDDILEDEAAKSETDKPEAEKKWISGPENAGADISEPVIPVKKRESVYSSEYGNSALDYVIESDLVTPDIHAVKDEDGKPLIVCVDDDFDTLDLLQIYLQRDYEYKAFSGPREAIFFLNQRVPTLVLVDCKIHTMRATTFMEIIRSGAGNENVKFVYTGTDEEFAEIDWDQVPGYVIGRIKRPVARGALQVVLDKISRLK